MTIKKDTILQVALELFANNGYANTSTSKIAKKAEVSEGLIFRHFNNKEGLLDAIVTIGLKLMEEYVLQMQNDQEPKKNISMLIDFPISIMEENRDYWQLVTSLKFQSPEIASKYQETESFKQVENILENAFSKLNYENPEMETKYLILTVSGLSNSIMHNKNAQEIEQLINFIKSKYNI